MERPCEEVFSLDRIRDLIPHLSQVMKLSPTRDRGKLGFIELLSSGGSRSGSGISVFMHVNRNFADAVNNSAYTLLSVLDEVDVPELRKTYNRILKMLD